MKRVFALAAALLLAVMLWAQSPEKMSYQSVVRDASNALVASQTVGMQLSILQGTASGTAVYVETQTPTTNLNGLVSLQIGSGALVSGDFTSINWSSGLYFVKTEIDLLGGNTYTITGTSQLMSVPFALYAKTSGNGEGPQGPEGPQGIQGELGGVGLQGIQGDAGGIGSQGEIGATGSIGLQGIQGDAGEIGPEGQSAYAIYATNNTDPDLSEEDWLLSLTGVSQEGPMMYSVIEGDDISTTSLDGEPIVGMTFSPTPGTYMVLFNAQMAADTASASPEFSSSQGVLDVATIYQDLMDMPGGIAHALTFGGGETLLPGVYDVTGAASIAGTLTLDGENDPNSIFIIRSTGAFTTQATTTDVVLINGASANNIFWVSQVAMSTGANTTMKGTLVSFAGAITLGAGTVFEGRIFTLSGALGVAANCVLEAPMGDSPVDLGVLSSFAMFTSSGAISADISSTIVGDVGTALGAGAIAGTLTGTFYPPGSTASTTPPVVTGSVTYSIYLNGTEVLNSSRILKLDSDIVSLQAMVTVAAENNPIEIHWKVDAGEAMLQNRILSLIRSGY
ncbi:MAG: ice-binding family protein [Flavobacteriales bacterium]